MKKVLILAILVIIVIVPVAAADTNGKDFGVGIYLGSPLGLTAKYDLDEELSVVGGLGFGGGIKVAGGVQYNFIDFSIEDLDFNVYFGANLGITFGTFNVSLEVPVGINYYFKDPAIEVFLEVGPVFNFVSMNAGAIGGIGARYELDM